jgi:uracil phosphoribosyltransferase
MNKKIGKYITKKNIYIIVVLRASTLLVTQI